MHRARCRRFSSRTRGSISGSGFPKPGKVRVSTGRVEIGQGVLTAMRQIAAEELGVDPARIVLQTGDTALTPNEGYTAGSQSIQFGGVALRLVCAEVRELFLDHAAAAFGYERTGLAVRDGAILLSGQPTGQDYWSLADAVDLSRERDRPCPHQKGRRIYGGRAKRGARRSGGKSVRRGGIRP